MINILLISVIALLSYSTYIAIRYGIQKDISHTYTLIKEKWVFTLILWITAIPIMMVGEHGLLFFAGTGICFVGASPKYWEKQEGIVHVVSAVGGIALATLWGILFGTWWIALIYIIFVLLVQLEINKKSIIKIRNSTWWVELGAFAMIIISLYIKGSKKVKLQQQE